MEADVQQRFERIDAVLESLASRQEFESSQEALEVLAEQGGSGRKNGSRLSRSVLKQFAEHTDERIAALIDIPGEWIRRNPKQ